MRNVIVTGGSRGLGLAVCDVLAASGYRVIAVARRCTPELEERSAAGRGAGAIEFRACDLSALDSLAAFVRAVRKDFGPIFGLINNAGLGTAGVLGTMRDSAIQKLVELNTTAPILLSKYAVRSMMTEREGRIVNMASIVALTGYSGLSVYSATKASLLGFTRALAREVGPLGITVNAVAPGFVSTDMTHQLDNAQRAKIAARSALKRLVEPIDVARAVEFLLSEAARNITGTTLTVDAGNSA